MEPVLQFLEGALRWLAMGVAVIVWLAFPGVLLLPALVQLPLPDVIAGGIVLGVSIVFWRGIRTWPTGRRLTEAVLAYLVKD
jgi:hypothetical protein